jgi:CheY-like chemotaxis protein
MAPHKGIVLVVDDDHDIRRTIGELLENAGYLVLEARDAHEALKRARGLTGRVVALVDLNTAPPNNRHRWPLSVK